MAATAESPRAGWRGVVVFLAIAYGLSWLTQIALALVLRQRGQSMTTLNILLLPIAIPLMGPPALGAFVARRWVERRNFADAGLRWPALRFWLIAWFLPGLLTLLTLVVSLPIYPFDTDFTALHTLTGNQPLPMPPLALIALQALSALTFAVPINSVFAFGEEFGWRGYLLPRLITLLGPWPGLLAHGAIWGLWHAPLIALLGYNYPQHRYLGPFLFIVSCTLLGAIFGWLHLASRSVLSPTIAHGAFNAIAGLPLLLLRDMDAGIAGVVFSPVGWLIMVVFIALLVRSGHLTGSGLREAVANLATTRKPQEDQPTQVEGYVVGAGRH